MKLPDPDKILQSAEYLRERSQYRKSLALFKKAMRGFSVLSDQDGLLECQLSIGDLNRMIGDFEAAAVSYAAAINTGRKIRNPHAVSDAKTGMGLSLRGTGDWKHALKYLSESHRFYQNKKDVQGTAFSLWAIAGTLRIKGDIPAAIRTYRKALLLFKRLKDIPATAYCYCGLGGASRVAGRNSTSLEYYLIANRLFSELKDRFGTAYSYCGIGNAFRMSGQYDRALSNFRQASAIYTKIGDRVSYSYTLWSIGTTYKMLAKHEKARHYFMTAWAHFRKTKDPRGIIYCRLGLGELAFLEGKKRSAGSHTAASLKLAKQYGLRVETCHAEMLTAYILGELRTTCYNTLGLKLQLKKAPFNIP